MSQKSAPVLLRNIDSKGSQPFEVSHAERLLAYPGTRWAKVEEGEEPTKSKKTPPAIDTPGQPTSI